MILSESIQCLGLPFCYTESQFADSWINWKAIFFEAARKERKKKEKGFVVGPYLDLSGFLINFCSSVEDIQADDIS